MNYSYMNDTGGPIPLCAACAAKEGFNEAAMVANIGNTPCALCGLVDLEGPPVSPEFAALFKDAPHRQTDHTNKVAATAKQVIAFIEENIAVVEAKSEGEYFPNECHTVEILTAAYLAMNQLHYGSPDDFFAVLASLPLPEDITLRFDRSSLHSMGHFLLRIGYLIGTGEICPDK